MECSPPDNDKRPESFHVNVDTIKAKEWLDTTTDKKWTRRKAIVLKLPIKSMCQVLKDAKEKDLSLGLVKPEQISFEWEKQSLSNQEARESCYAQLTFFDKKKNAIEKIPYSFYYQFHCVGETDCPHHKLSIIDWEIGEAYRAWRWRYKPESQLLEKIKERWLNGMCLKNTEPYFFVGNMKRFRETFMVLGTFYPPKQP